MPFDPDSLLADRYQIDTLLGANGNRETWKATDTDDGSSVTLKTLFFGRHMQWQDLKLQEREAATLSTLSHPRIPRHRASFWSEQPEGNYLCLVQEYIPGASLAEKLSRGERLDVQAIRRMAREVLDILIYLHEQSPPVVHRDIKPSNLIEGSDGSISLIDFGAVQAGTVGGQTVTVVGTFGYMPPEQFGGRTVPASDLYALGVTLVALLTGTSPGDWPEGKPPLDTLRKNDLSLCQWLKRLTETELARRINSAHEALVILDGNTVIEKPRRRLVEAESSSTLARLEIAQTGASLMIHMPASCERADLLFPLIAVLLAIFSGIVASGFILILAVMLFYTNNPVAFAVVVSMFGAALSWLMQKTFLSLSQTWHKTKSQTIVFRGSDCELRDSPSEQCSRVFPGGRVWNVQPLLGSRTGLRLCSLSPHGNTCIEWQLPLNETEVSPLAGLINRWLADHPGD